jgi:DNA repair exonuclease SbcCD nuclease subunit
MKFVFTADIHLKMWNDKVYDENGLPLRLVEILNSVEQMCEYARENDIKDVIIGGDLNDTKGLASVRAFVLFNELVKRYDDMTFFILHGNHDSVASEYNNKESAVQLISGNNNVINIVDPTTFKNILFIPYSKNILEEIKNNKTEEHNILVSHFGLNEASLSTGISLQTSISVNHLTQFKLVLLGHYHKPQHIENNETSIYYVGSPIPVRRDEVDETKRFLVVDSETCEVNAVNIEGYRKYFQFIINEDSDIKSMKEDIEKYKNAGHYVVVKNMLSNIPKEFEDVIESVQYVDLYEPDVNIRGIDVSMSIENQLKKYIELENVHEEDREEYYKVGLECVTEADRVDSDVTK